MADRRAPVVHVGRHVERVGPYAVRTRLICTRIRNRQIYINSEHTRRVCCTRMMDDDKHFDIIHVMCVWCVCVCVKLVQLEYIVHFRFVYVRVTCL